ncbi:MAG: DUF4397 domain-containing protein [Myxococcales bacterium]|nr:DUF4397 domain-containing protein [Myxococcales bacterium]
MSTEPRPVARVSVLLRVVTVACVLAVAACSDPGSTAPTLAGGPSPAPTAYDPTTPASLRLVNATSASTTLSVNSESVTVAAFDVGRYLLVPMRAPSTSVGGQPLPYQAWRAGRRYTVVLTDAGTVVLEDPPAAPQGSLRVRGLSGATDLPVVELTQPSDESPLGPVQPSTITGPLSPLQLSATATVARPLSGIRLVTTPTAGLSRYFDCPVPDLGSDALVFVVSSALEPVHAGVLAVGRTATRRLDCTERDARAELRFLHAADGSEALALRFDGTTLASGAFPSASGWTTVPAIAGTADVVVTGGPDAPLAEAALALNAADRQTLVALDGPTGPRLLPLPVPPIGTAHLLSPLAGLVLGDPDVDGPGPLPAGESRLVAPGDLTVRAGQLIAVCAVAPDAIAVVLPTGPTGDDGTPDGLTILNDVPGAAPALAPCTVPDLPTGTLRVLNATRSRTLDIGWYPDGVAETLIAGQAHSSASAPFKLPAGELTLRIALTAGAADPLPAVLPKVTLDEGARLDLIVWEVAGKLGALVAPTPLGAPDGAVFGVAHIAESLGPVAFFARLDAGADALPAWAPFADLTLGESTTATLAGTALELGVGLGGADAAPALVCRPGVFPAGTAASLVLRDGPDDSTELLVWTGGVAAVPCEAPKTASMRVLDAARLDMAVTTTLDGKPLPPLNFGDESSVTAVGLDAFTAVAKAGALSAALGPALLDDAQHYTAAVVGNGAGISWLLLADMSTSNGSTVALRVVHAAAGAGALDLALVTPTGDVDFSDGLAFGQTSPAVSVNPTPTILAITDATGRVECAVSTITAGDALTAFVATPPEGGRVLLVQATSDDTVDGSAATPPVVVPCTKPSDATLRVFAVTPDPITVALDGQLTSLVVEPTTSAEVGLNAGEHPVTLGFAGQSASTASITVAKGDRASAFALGTAPVTLAFVHQPAENGSTRWRVLQGAANTTYAVTARPTQGAAVPLSPLGLGAASAAFVTTAGPLNLEVDLGGDATPEALCALDGPSGGSVHVALMVQSGGLAAWVAPNHGTPVIVPCTSPDLPAFVSVLNVYAGVPALDLVSGDDAVVSGLLYTKATGYLELPPGETLAVTTPTAPVPLTSLPVLNPGFDHTAVLYGVGPQVALFTDDPTAPPPGEARVRVIHAGNAPTYGISGPIAMTLEAGHASGYLNVSPQGTLIVDTDGDGAPNRACTLTLTAGTISNAVLFGDDSTVALILHRATGLSGETTLVPCPIP